MSAQQGSAVVLLSAGLDSSYNLFKAIREIPVVLALTFNYGQRAARRELEAARELADLAGVPHKVIDLPWFRDFTQTSLVSDTAEVPTADRVSIDDLVRSEETARAVWVPNRNGILLNIAAGFAEGLGASMVIPGFNREEATTFPDNSAAYLTALDGAFRFSTANGVTTRCYSIDLDKTQIVADGLKLGLPFDRLWPCYFAGEKWCGQCESCQRFRRALEANGLAFEEFNR